MWDVVYWTYGVVFFVAVTGDWAWWLWGAIPVYSVWKAWGMYSGMRGGGGFTDAAGVPQPESATSRRQEKREKRGGQKVSYR
jgi:hypothetical protein